jgi:hypothetical protein
LINKRTNERLTWSAGSRNRVPRRGPCYQDFSFSTSLRFNKQDHAAARLSMESADLHTGTIFLITQIFDIASIL